MKIYDRKIGINEPTYFIAEIGSNFDGSLKRAKELIKIAADHGADAVKFQHYTAETLVSDIGFRNLDKSVETHQSNWKESVSTTYDKASLNKDWTQELYETAHDMGIGFFTSPYSEPFIDYVEPYVDAYKIGSGDITYSEIIKKISKKGKPVLIASGAATMDEVVEAMQILMKNTSDVCLMQCNTNYEGLLESSRFQNLNVLNSFKTKFPNAVLGLSCHMPKWTSVLGSVALGARVIEKHFTDDRNREGPDHGFAINPKEWEQMVSETRLLESMLGSGEKVVEENEQKTVIVQQRSLRAKFDLKKGQIINREMLDILRPCPEKAVKPNRLDEIIGKTVVRDISIGDCIFEQDIE
jgi:sialic acid synthase SpsE